MKGIILAGGSGTRLAPLTNLISKQLLPVYDKPMICYPLSTLMNIDIKDILIISTKRDLPNIENYLGDGSKFGLNLSYKVQDEPKGIADAFVIGKDFIGNSSVCLILGDNIFYGYEISLGYLKRKVRRVFDNNGACVFAYHVKDPKRYGVVEFDVKEKAISIEEKPQDPKSNWAVTGFYIYDNNVVKIAENLQPSARGEIEITDVNKIYLKEKKLQVVNLKRGFAWLDAGTPDSLLESSTYIQTIEKRQGLKIACLEEVAFRKGFISKEQFICLLKDFKKGDYYDYLNMVLKESDED